MTKDQFEREKNYRSALAIAKSMLIEEIINQDDYLTIDTILINEFRPLFGGMNV
jgi:hypothetical protein